MTHEEFNSLYNAGRISIKTFAGIVGEESRVVESFTWNGRYFLRIHKEVNYLSRENRKGKRCRMTYDQHFIKEFSTAAAANSYFKKVSEGQLKRI